MDYLGKAADTVNPEQKRRTGSVASVWSLVNVAARLVVPPPPTKTFGLNSVEPGAPLGRIWVPLIKFRRELRGPRGLGCSADARLAGGWAGR